MALNQVDTGSYMATITNTTTGSIYRVVTNSGDDGITSVSITKTKGTNDNTSYTAANQKAFHNKVIEILKDSSYGITKGL